MSALTFLGQPAALRTLFLTEMWERFTYYGMRAVLILFFVGSASGGGMALDDRTASSIYGLYISGTYVFALFGGWVADRLIGPQRAVIAGACLILAGNLLLALGRTDVFFCGLLVIVLGVGLLKPNISAMVARLYPDGGSRRDAGFSIFYVGISVGALLGSLLVPACAAAFGWRAAFCAPAAGMAVGLGIFLSARSQLPSASAVRATAWMWSPVFALIAGVALLAGLCVAGRLRIDPARAADASSWLIGLAAGGYFLYLLLGAGLSAGERRRVVVMIALFAAYTVFYAGFEQGGASMNLFAERYTERTVGGLTIPAGMLQGTTALYTILLAPLFARLWVVLGRQGRDPPSPVKFAAGLGLLGLGALVMVATIQRLAVSGHKVLPTSLLLTYLLEECGDLCLSPVGLSSMTKLAPPRFVGQVMGVWFLAVALGNNLAGQLSASSQVADMASLAALFGNVAAWSFGAALALAVFCPWLARQMRGAA